MITWKEINTYFSTTLHPVVGNRENAAKDIGPKQKNLKTDKKPRQQ